MDHTAGHNTDPDQTEELRLSLEKLETAVNTTPARGVPKPLFIAVAALAMVLGIMAAYLLYFDRDYQRNLALAHAGYEHASQERDEAQSALTKVQDELSRAQADLAQARDTIGLLEEWGAQVWFTDSFPQPGREPSCWSSADFTIREDGTILPPARN